MAVENTQLLKNLEMKGLGVDARVDYEQFPENSQEGSKFDYFRGSLGDLHESLCARAQDPLQEESLRKTFQEIVHPDFDVIKEIQAVLPPEEEGVTTLYLSTQAGPPNIHLVTTDATIKALRELGMPVRFGGIVSYDDDAFIPDEMADGIKSSYADPIFVHCNGKTELLTGSLFDQAQNTGVSFRYINVDNPGPFAQVLDLATERGLIEPGEPLTVTHFYELVSKMAGIDAYMCDKSPLDKVTMAYLLTRSDLSHLNSSQRSEPIYSVNKPGEIGERGSLKNLFDSELGGIVRELMREGKVDEATKLLDHIRLSSRIYYSAIPTQPTIFAHGNRALIECYEDAPSFTKMVNNGFNSIKQGVTLVNNDGKRKGPRQLPGAPYGSTVVQEAWLSGLKKEGNKLVPLLNGIGTAGRQEVTSLAIPTFVFDPQMRSQYQQFVVEKVAETFGEDVFNRQFADVHAAVIIATIQFMQQL